MQDLISIKEKEGIDFITSLKEIYLKAEMSRKHWAKWLYRNVTENKFFKENKDYQTFPHWENGNESLDVTCTLDMAKHLVMQMPTNKAFELRQYLIDYEKNHKKEVLPQLTEMEMIVKIANNQLAIDKKFIEIDNKIDSVINTVTIESNKQRKIQLEIANRVYKLLPEPQPDLSNDDIKIMTRKFFSGLHKDLRNKFLVSTYKDIKVIDYEKALEFIREWV